MIQTSPLGFYGEFGGAYIPELLHRNINELKSNYRKIISTDAFQRKFQNLLKDYVGRPTPLYLAERLSDYFGTPIFLKREDLCHTGAHKINNTIGQVLLAQSLGKQNIIAETGAGQHGVATATVCALMGLNCKVFMGKLDMERQAINVERMRLLGAEVIAAESGSQTLKDATNEAMRYWIQHSEDTHYIIGSVVGPHPYPQMVMEFQSVISQEVMTQLEEQIGRSYPDYLLACVGGGSNAAGIFYHFIGNPKVRLIGLEAAGEGVITQKTAATLSKGTVGILHGSKSFVMQDADGQVTEPYSISAGLDYPGVGPLHAHLFKDKKAEYYPITDKEAMEAGILCCRLEGILPAIETAHAIAYLAKIDVKDRPCVVLNFSGRGDKDLATYSQWQKEN